MCALCILNTRLSHIPYFFDQTPCLLCFFFFLLHVFVQLLFEGGVCLFGKPAYTKDTWIMYMYMQAIQWRLLDVSSKHSLSVLIYPVETSCTTRTGLVLVDPVIVARNYLRMSTRAVCSSHGYYLRAVFILLRAPHRVATIRGWRLFKGHFYLKNMVYLFQFPCRKRKGRFLLKISGKRNPWKDPSCGFCYQVCYPFTYS